MKISGFGLKTNILTGTIGYQKNLEIFFSTPIVAIDSSRMILNSPTDTLTPVFVFTDTLQKNGEIRYDWVQGDSYHLIINDSTFTDLGGNYNDSIAYRFRFRTPEDYGFLFINILLPDSLSTPFIIQLMNEKELIIHQKTIKESGKVKFEYLLPGKYKLKAISDINANGKWDSGRYTTALLPEKVWNFSAPIEIRANWDLQEDWQLK